MMRGESIYLMTLNSHILIIKNKIQMKKIIYLTLMATLFTQCKVSSQTPRTIEVTGIAEMEVVPDEICISLGIKEYWIEEFLPKTKQEDYKTKYPIEKIEVKLQNIFNRLHINKDQITLQSAGNYWRYDGKDFLVEKKFDIKITDFSILDSLIKLIDRKGVDYMNISELKNKKITDYRKEVKVRALKAAKDKAGYLLESIGKSVGDPKTITELIDQYSGYFSYWGYQNQNYQSQVSNAQMPSSDENPANMRKIKLKYSIKAQFEIKS